jgi:hypothetical protein
MLVQPSFDDIPSEIISAHILPHLDKNAHKQMALTHWRGWALVWDYRQRACTMYIKNCNANIAPYCRSIHISSSVLQKHRSLLIPVVRDLSLLNAHHLNFALDAFDQVNRLTLFLNHSKLPWWHLLKLRLVYLRINGTTFDAHSFTGLLLHNRKTLQEVRIGATMQSPFVFKTRRHIFPQLRIFLCADTKCYLHYTPSTFPLLAVCNTIYISDIEVLRELIEQRWETRGKPLAKIYTPRGHNVLALQLFRCINYNSNPDEIASAAELLELLSRRGITLGTSEMYHMYLGNAVIYDILLNTAKIKLSEFQQQTLVARLINRFHEDDLQPASLMLCIRELVTKHGCRVPSMREIVIVNPSLTPIYRFLIESGASDHIYWLTSLALYQQLTSNITEEPDDG